ncbi:MAG: bifunctional precorrin-2 dehydrogenase/sirohydrochlorin ferrochelatase [Thermoleophilia bacterium]
MTHLPIFVDLVGRTCAVVGGGRVAEGRVRTLLGHGATVRLISPEVCAGLEEMLGESQIEFRQRTYEVADIEGCLMVIAATDRRDVNAAIARDAAEAGVLCNVVDRPEDGDVVVPAQVRRGRLAIALTTGGASPAVASVIRGRLEDLFGPEWEILLDMLAERRDSLIAAYPDTTDRSRVVREFLDGEAVERLARDERALVEAALDALLRGDR